MKVECPVCGRMGILQVRGNSERVQHYVGFKDGKRVYLYHKVGAMEVTGGSIGSKLLEVNKLDSVFSGQNRSWGWELNPHIAALCACVQQC